MSDPLRGFDPKGTYDAASLDYERASRAFWEQLSSRTVRLASPMPGESVLDDTPGQWGLNCYDTSGGEHGGSGLDYVTMFTVKG